MSLKIQNGILQQTGIPKIEASLQDEDVLWRYMDTAKFFDFIYGSKLYLARGDQLKDKFEGTFTQGMKTAITNSFKENDINCTYSKFKTALRGKVFLNCWHLSKDDNMAMWNIYGQSDAAVVITTTIKQLYEAIKTEALPYFVTIKKVQYIKHWRDPEININPYSNVFSYKVSAYEYEKEVRVLVDRFENSDIDDLLVEKGMTVPVDQNKFLRSIVLSPTAPEWFISLVGRAVKEKGITTDVRRSKIWSDPF